MSRLANNVQIKIETNELQTYLDTFNKEIEEGSRSLSNSLVDAADLLNAHSKNEGNEETGTYFVDEAGNYYYQATKDSDPIPTDPPDNVEIIGEDSESVILTIKESNLAQNKNKTRKTSKSIAKKSKSKTNKYITYEIDEENELDINDLNDDGALIEEDIQDGGIDDDDDDDGNEDHEDDEENEDSDKEIFEFDENEDESVKSTEIPLKVVKVSNKVGVHPCPYCEYVTSKRYLLARHMKCHSDDRPFKCPVCERGFKTNASLQNHTNTHTGNKPYGCKFCTSNFTTSGELVRHVRYKHTHEKPHKCTECDYASVELSKLKRHIRCHTGERPFQCPHCTYASPDTFKLKRHLRTHTGEKPYQCDICQSKFTQSNSLKQHKLIHSVGDKPVFQCHLCPTTCGRKTDLRIHIQKLHTSDRPLLCKRCGKTFPDRYNYKVHSKTHEGEKCFKCDLCPYASISQRHLDSHLLIHTDQKPFECKICYQTFRQKQLLRRHQNLYHNEGYVPPKPQDKTHTCPDCKRAFSRKGNLMRHMVSHDPHANVKLTNLKLNKPVVAKPGSEEGEDDGDDVDDANEDGGVEGTSEILSGVDEEDLEERLDYEIEEEQIEEDCEDGTLTQYIETAAADMTNFEEVIIKKEDERDLVAVDSMDDQYMVVEIVQSEDEDNDVTLDQEQPTIKDELDDEDEFVISELTDDGVNIIRGSKMEVDAMEDCFGFSESEEIIEESTKGDSEDEDYDNKELQFVEVFH